MSEFHRTAFLFIAFPASENLYIAENGACVLSRRELMASNGSKETAVGEDDVPINFIILYRVTNLRKLFTYA